VITDKTFFEKYSQFLETNGETCFHWIATKIRAFENVHIGSLTIIMYALEYKTLHSDMFFSVVLLWHKLT